MKFPIVIELDRDGAWVTHVPALNDISTFGATREEALERTDEMIRGYVAAALQEGIELPAASASMEVQILDVAV